MASFQHLKQPLPPCLEISALVHKRIIALHLRKKKLIDMQSGPDVHVTISDFTSNYFDKLTTDEKITFKEYLIDNPKKCSMFEQFGREKKMANIRKTLVNRVFALSDISEIRLLDISEIFLE